MNASPNGPFGAANPPAAASDENNGHLYTFWKGTDGNLWEATSTSAGDAWAGPTKVGMGPLGSIPTATVRENHEVDVFWKGTDGNLWMAKEVGGLGNLWTGPTKLGFGPLGSRPSATSWGTTGNGEVDVFWEGTDRNIWEAFESASATVYTGPLSIGMGPLGSAPAASAPFFGTGEQDVYWKGTDSGLWYAFFSSGAWHGPFAASVGSLAGPPTADVQSLGSTFQYNVYWEGSDAALWTVRSITIEYPGLIAASWSRPFFLGMGALGSTPAATNNDDLSTSYVFWQGTDRALWFAYDRTVEKGVFGPLSPGMGPLG